ncbi:unnamed protein product [Prunus brigantina]
MERKKDGSFKLKVREVMVDKVADYASCICKKFEFEGILCRHDAENISPNINNPSVK